MIMMNKTSLSHIGTVINFVQTKDMVYILSD